MLIPDYIDNKQQKLKTVLERLIEDENQIVLDIATGFFRIEAWLELENAMKKLTSLRLLIGRDPTIRPVEGEIDLVKHINRIMQLELENKPFEPKYKQEIDRVIEYFEQDHIQMRLFGVRDKKSHFFHAKAYIFDKYSIVGSSNFTTPGLKGNTELNVVNKIETIARDLRQNWFESFWDDKSVDTDYKQKFIAVLNASKFGSKPYTPYQVFLKALYELFKDDSIAEDAEATALQLASFQKQGFASAVKLLETYNGCIIADAVGLGKTYIGLRVIDYYLQKLRTPGKVPRALVICPAQLKELVWRKKTDEFGLKVDIISQEEIGRKTFDNQRYLQHDLIVVDESHNFRNSNTNRHENLMKLISGGKKDKKVLLLTATPINNNVFDLYHQLLFLTRGNNQYYSAGNDPVSDLKEFFNKLNKKEVEILNLLLKTMVRRSRVDVMRRQKAGEPIEIAGKILKFPNRTLRKFTYSFEATFNGLYAGIAEQIDRLFLAPYNIKQFKKSKLKNDRNEVKRNTALVALQKALYLKRLESSLAAFKKTIDRQKEFQEQFYKILTAENKLLDSKNFRKLLLTIDEDDSEPAEELIDQLEEIKIADYNTALLKKHIEQDLIALNEISNKLNEISRSLLQGKDSDRKLIAFKETALKDLKGKKLLIFSYYKDTADYLYYKLIHDTDWLTKMGNPVIELITGDTDPVKRSKLVKRFSPKANAETEDEKVKLLANPIDILITTDVLSEGQNLQDAGYLLNYDLHWNPVRMIQRAGRIDRLGTEYEQLYIYNCFPEEGLEELLGLVKRLQERIETIDREVGLDASVLGESITGRSLELLEKMYRSRSEQENAEIIEQLEAEAELPSLDEMRLPLLQYIQEMGDDAMKEIPMGIHSTREINIPNYPEGGIFIAFKTIDDHHWHFYPRKNGVISTLAEDLILDKGKIFNWIRCQPTATNNLIPVKFDDGIFVILKGATRNLLEKVKKTQTAKKIKPRLHKYWRLIDDTLSKKEQQISDKNASTVAKIMETISNNANIKAYDKNAKKLWNIYEKNKDINELIAELNSLLTENQLYEEPEEETPAIITSQIQQEDIKLVCYEWLKPKQTKA